MRNLILFILVIAFAACNSDSTKPAIVRRTNQKDSTDNISTFSGEDAAMNAAIDSARKTYPEFLNTLRKGCDDCERFAVKIRLTFNDIDGEHVWLDSIKQENGRVFGILANVPERVSNVNINDKLEVKPDSLSDWMYVQEGKLVGGYTLKAIFDRMNEVDKKDLESQFGAKIR